MTCSQQREVPKRRIEAQIWGAANFLELVRSMATVFFFVFLIRR